MKRRLATLLVVSVLAAGCGTDSTPPPAPPETTAAAEPAEAPAAEQPAGTVVPLQGAPEGIVISASGAVALGVRDPDGIRLLDLSGEERAFVASTGAPRHLSLAGPDGPILAPLEASDELLLVDPSNGAILSTVPGVGRQPHDAVITTDGTIVVTNEMGGGVVFVRDGVVAGSLPAGPVQPGGVAAVGEYAAVADVQGNGVWIYSGRDRALVARAPLGRKLTHAIGLGGDLAAFADTDGDAVFIERVDPQVTEVARIEAPGSPYGLAYDAARRLLFVTLTESNLLRVIDLTNPSVPAIVTDVPTVRQPNSVAVEPASGTVLVTGSDAGNDGALQIIPAGSAGF